MFQRIRHRGGIRKMLEGLALTAAARQEHGRALRLAGAAASMWHEYRDDGGRQKDTRPELDHALMRARTEDGPRAAAAWLDGWNRPIDETIAYALAGDATTTADPVRPDGFGNQRG
jgi:hypothetical protein